LIAQTRRPDRIIVIADNCTDRTVEIVQVFTQSWPCVEVFATENNQNRKAGAINQVLETLSDEVNYVLLMDADTSLGEHAIEIAANYLEAHQDTAAVCSRAGVQDIHDGATLFERLLHRLQRIEYAMADSQRIERPGAIRCIHGMAAMHRFKMLQRVGFYNVASIVEDYHLTIAYKECGYKAATDLDMRAWTLVPTNLRDWWQQRVRWSRGAMDTLREYGWSDVTRSEILLYFLMAAIDLTRSTFYGLLLFYLFASPAPIRFHPACIITLSIYLMDILYRMKYVEDASVADYMIRLLLIPDLLYYYLRAIVRYYSYILSFLNTPQDW